MSSDDWPNFKILFNKVLIKYNFIKYVYSNFIS